MGAPSVQRPHGRPHPLTAALKDGRRGPSSLGGGKSPFAESIHGSANLCPGTSLRGIDHGNGFRLRINDMIRHNNRFLIDDNDLLEVYKDEESGEEERVEKEGGRNPSIQVGVIPWRGIVGHNRRPFAIVIIADHRRLRCSRGLTSAVLFRQYSNYRLLKLQRHCP